MKTCLLFIGLMVNTMIFGQGMLNLQINPSNFGCGVTTVTATSNCSFNGAVTVGIQGMPAGISVGNVSLVTNGSFTFDVTVSPQAPANGVLQFTVLTSDNPTGCSLPGFTANLSFTANCTCNLTINLDITHETCLACNNGSATINVAGGNGAITVQWSNGQTGLSAGPLAPGAHSVVVTDAVGCSVVRSFTVNMYICPGFNIISAVSHVLCHDECNGSINISLSNGSNGFQAVWNGGLTGAFISDLCAGTYTVTITDSDNCQLAENIVVTQPAQATAEVIDVSPAMNGLGGSIILAFDGPEPLGAGYIKFEGVPGVINPTNNQISFSDLIPGCYDIVLEDINGCEIEVLNICVENISSTSDHKATNWTISPNPASDYIQIQGVNSSTDISVDVYNTSGVKMLTLRNEYLIDLSPLPSGIYILNIITDSGLLSKKFSKI